MKEIKLNDNIVFGGGKLVIVAGPCAIEDDINITNEYFVQGKEWPTKEHTTSLTGLV